MFSRCGVAVARRALSTTAHARTPMIKFRFVKPGNGSAVVPPSLTRPASVSPRCDGRRCCASSRRSACLLRLACVRARRRVNLSVSVCLCASVVLMLVR
jgi:hypothetical protein